LVERKLFLNNSFMEKLPLNVAQIARRQKVAISVYIFLISMNTSGTLVSHWPPVDLAIGLL
jgi:hypothetical protein